MFKNINLGLKVFCTILILLSFLIIIYAPSISGPPIILYLISVATTSIISSLIIGFISILVLSFLIKVSWKTRFKFGLKCSLKSVLVGIVFPSIFVAVLSLNNWQIIAHFVKISLMDADVCRVDSRDCRATGSYLSIFSVMIFSSGTSLLFSIIFSIIEFKKQLSRLHFRQPE